VGESVVINDPDGEFKVTAFDANHCPGIFFFFLYYDDDYLVCFIIDF
jgi:hypothetical protein